MPTCPAPELTCEVKAAVVDACAHFFVNQFGAASMEPWVPNDPEFMTCEQKCVRYASAAVQITNTLSADDGDGHTLTITLDHTYTRTYEFTGTYGDEEDPRVCDDSFVWSGSGESTEEWPYVADNVLTKQVIEYTLNEDGTANGTVTDTYPDPLLNESYPIDPPNRIGETFEPATEWNDTTKVASSADIESYDGGGGLVGTVNWTLAVTYTDAVTKADMEAEAALALAAEDWADIDICTAEREIIRGICIPEDEDPEDEIIPGPEPVPACVDGISERWLRYKWCIPATHHGSFYRIEWDEVFYPVGWDDEEAPEPPVPVVTPRSWEWEGPAGGANDEDEIEENDTDSRCSPWSLAVKAPAEGEGIVEIRNVRVLCYRSAYGQKFELYESFGVYIEPDP